MSTINKIGPFKPSPFNPNSGIPPMQAVKTASPNSVQPKFHSDLPAEGTQLFSSPLKSILSVLFPPSDI